MALEVMN